ncbi:K Homology domain [Macleaya cordata]|uniref:K Homology domain n=1 Tax=Macleaya cordata TaxID=56857 RepID=A0A200QWY4_MACCD|nr:K Homology domain [Macleaya cordata]
MAAKVDPASSVERPRAQTTVMTTTSAASASSPKVSMFGKKSGFVIPKNKLSGSLVPIFRGTGKMEGREAAKEEGIKQAQRKTKWGADLTQDAAVLKGRALAYQQTRVEQITQQLKSGVLEKGDDKGSESQTEVPDPESSRPQKDSQLQKFEMLELEKREAIGEILKLNPSYKVPPDYKPLLKEAKIPIPLTRYPGYNFIGVILGSGSNTQKRLEEETGAKIKIHGTKAGTGEKGEITSSDGNEVQSAFEELYVHVSADTFEKVDAAVALIELLVAPVSGNSAVASTTSAAGSGDSLCVLNQNQKDTANATSYMMPIGALNQGFLQPMMGPSQPGSVQVQFQPYRGPWYPPGAPHTATLPPSGFVPSPNSSAPMPNNAIQFPPTPINPSNMRPFFSGQPQPPTSTGFGTVPRNPSPFAPRPQPLMQGMQQPYMPEVRPPSQGFPSMNHPMPNQQNLHGYPSMPPQPNPAMPHSQPFPTGPAPAGGQMLYSTPQQGPTTAMGLLAGRQLTPGGSSTGWSGVTLAAPASFGMTNMMQIARPMVPPQSLYSVGPQPSVGASLNAPTTVMSGSTPGNMVSPTGFPFQPSNQLPGTPVNRPTTGLAFAPRPPQVGHVPVSASLPPLALPSNMPSSASAPSSMAEPTSAPLSVFSQAPALAPAPNQSSLPMAAMQPVVAQGSARVPPPVSLASSQPQSGTPISVSGSLPSFTPINPPLTSQGSIPPPVTAPRPQRPISGDFTFQPLRPQHPASSQTNPGPSNQSVAQNALHITPKPTAQPPPPQAPSFRPAVQNSTLQVGMQGFPSPRATNHVGQPQSPVPGASQGSVIPFAANTASIQPPPRLPSFPNPNPVLLTSPIPQQARQMSNSPGSLPPRPVNPSQLQQNYQLTPTTRPGSLMVPNQQFSNNVTLLPSKQASSPGGNQVYDPFSPTSIPASAPQQGDDSAKKRENDPEYDDLMASVGVR